MFPQGTYHWEATKLDGQKIDRVKARCSADRLDPKTLKEFRLKGRGTLLLPIIAADKTINVNGIDFLGSDVVISTPARFAKIMVVNRKRFPLTMSGDVKEIYVLKLFEGDKQIVVTIEPRGVRILREEPVLEVS
jgi:hypothetical protein